MVISSDVKLKIANANRANPYSDIIPYALGLGFPIVSYLGFHPQQNEALIYATPAYIFKDKEQIIGYTGKTAGVSVRVAKGLTLRSGGGGGKPIRGDVRKISDGDLLVTNQRVIFVGKDETFDFKVNKISTVKLIDQNSFIIQSGKSSKNIGVDSALIVYVYALINYVISENSKGSNIYEIAKNQNSHLTNEQIEICEQVRMEISRIRPKNNKNQSKKKTRKLPIIILLAILLFWLASAIRMNGNLSSNDSNDFNESPKYTALEIVSLDGHPVAFDSFERAKEFYKAYDNVRIYDTMKNGGAYTKADEFLIYMENGASRSGFVDEINLNLNLSEEFKGLNLEDVVEIAVSYLPMDIMAKYYDKYRVFCRGNDSIKFYHYSWRLNASGIEYHNNGHPELSRDYGFVIRHDLVSNTFSIKINIFARDVSMMGGHSDEWFEKNTEPWDIDLTKYQK